MWERHSSNIKHYRLSLSTHWVNIKVTKRAHIDFEIAYCCTENSLSSIEESGEYASSTVEASSEVPSSALSSTEKISSTMKPKCFQLPAYVNPQGVRFTSGEDDEMEGGEFLSML